MTKYDTIHRGMSEKQWGRKGGGERITEQSVHRWPLFARIYAEYILLRIDKILARRIVSRLPRNSKRIQEFVKRAERIKRLSRN